MNQENRHPSVIQFKEKEEVIRQDFCAECWEKTADRQYFSFWLTKRIQAPTAKERRLAKAERNEALWRLFLALYSSEEERGELAPQLFLLAHLLMKYKVLNYEGTDAEGRLQFSHSKLSDTFLIEEVPLDEVDFVTVKQEIEERAAGYAPGDEEEQEKQSPGGDEN